MLKIKSVAAIYFFAISMVATDAYSSSLPISYTFLTQTPGISALVISNETKTPQHAYIKLSDSSNAFSIYPEPGKLNNTIPSWCKAGGANYCLKPCKSVFSVILSPQETCNVYIHAENKGIVGAADHASMSVTDASGRQSFILNNTGVLYAGGYFHTANETPVYNIAKWDGETWSAVGGSVMTNQVQALAVDPGGMLYAGTISTSGGANCLFAWDGQDWIAAGPENVDGIISPVLTVDSLQFDNNGILYLGGISIDERGLAALSWDGNAWTVPGGAGVQNQVMAFSLDSLTNDLYVGGSFGWVDNKNVNNIAEWTARSTWKAVSSDPASTGSGLNEAVFSLAFDPVHRILYAGGLFYQADGDNVTDAVAKWNGRSWQGLGKTGLGGVVSPQAFALALDQKQTLYVGGNFRTIDGHVMEYIGQWSGSQWRKVEKIGMNQSVEALVVDKNNVVYAGGNFTEADRKKADFIASLDAVKFNATWRSLGNAGQNGVAGTDGSVFALAINNELTITSRIATK